MILLPNSNLTFRPSPLLPMRVDTRGDLNAFNCHSLSASQHALGNTDHLSFKRVLLEGGKKKNITFWHSTVICF